MGGATSATFPHSKQPNSFVYRFVSQHPHDLTHGALQALQVLALRNGQPIVFRAGQPEDAASSDVGDLHAYGNVFKTRWVTLHDTAADGTASFDANALAKAQFATPLKRPENAQFRPGTHFGEFYFAETGDTDIRTEVGSAFGGLRSGEWSAHKRIFRQSLLNSARRARRVGKRSAVGGAVTQRNRGRKGDVFDRR